MTAPDPAVVAGKEAAEAEAAFNAVPGSTPADEETREYRAAGERMNAADDAFADAPITSAVGALAKMREICGPHVETAVNALATAGPDLVRYLVEFPFGDIYTRPSLDSKSREIDQCLLASRQ